MTELLHSLRLWLNAPLFTDSNQSYLAITMLRVIVIGLIVLAVTRGLQALGELPDRHPDQSLIEHFKEPWWKFPMALVCIGLSGTALMFGLQSLAGLDTTEAHSLNQLNLYFLLTYLFYGTAAFGMAVGAGHIRGFVKRSKA